LAYNPKRRSSFVPPSSSSVLTRVKSSPDINETLVRTHARKQSQSQQNLMRDPQTPTPTPTPTNMNTTNTQTQIEQTSTQKKEEENVEDPRIT